MIYPSSRPTFFLTLVIIVILSGMATRYINVKETVVHIPIRADAAQYYTAAWNLKSFGVLSTQMATPSQPVPRPTTDRPPGYPLFLLPFVDLPPTPDVVNHITSAQALVSVLTLLLSLALFARFMRWPYAILGGTLTALSPHLNAANVYVLTESLFTFFLILYAWCTAKLLSSRSWKWAWAAGAALGLSALVRETTTHLIVFFIPFLFLSLDTSKRKHLAALALAGFFVAYAAWPIRNQLIDVPSPSIPRAVESMHNGMYPDLTYGDIPQSRGRPHRFDPAYDQIDNYPALFSAIEARFMAEPLKYLQWYLVGKPLMFLSWDAVAGIGDVFVYPIQKTPYIDNPMLAASHHLMRTLHWPTVFLGLLGALLVWLPSAKTSFTHTQLLTARFLSLIIAYFILVHTIATPLPRYATPIRPFLFGFAALALQIISQTIHQRGSDKRQDPT